MAAVEKRESIALSPATNEKLTSILSIDRGGIRGIIPITILAFLRKELQKLDDPEARNADYFGAIGGTSTGGIVTAMLTTPDDDDDDQNGPPIPVKEREKFCHTDGPKIFSEDAKVSKHNLSGWNLRSKFSMVCKKIKEFCKDKLLSETLTNVVIPAYDMQEMRPIIFSSQQAKEKSFKVKLEDVVVSTSAAPYFFPLHTFTADGKRYFLVDVEIPADDKTYHLVDGGLAANNPTLLAIREATKILKKENPSENLGNCTDQPNYNNFPVLSLGTGSVDKREGHEIGNGGVLDWLAPLFKSMSTASDDMVNIYTSLVSGNCNPPDNYLRIQGSMKAGELKIDDAGRDYGNKLKNIGKDLPKRSVSKTARFT